MHLGLSVYSILKDIMKDTGEQSGEGVHRARSGRVLSTGTSVPVELECSPTQKLSKPYDL